MGLTGWTCMTTRGRRRCECGGGGLKLLQPLLVLQWCVLGVGSTVRGRQTANAPVWRMPYAVPPPNPSPPSPPNPLSHTARSTSCSHLAADQGLTEAVAILSTSGADLNIPREEDSRTPL
jgi:hypothetical protein